MKGAAADGRQGQADRASAGRYCEDSCCRHSRSRDLVLLASRTSSSGDNDGDWYFIVLAPAELGLRGFIVVIHGNARARGRCSRQEMRLGRGLRMKGAAAAARHDGGKQARAGCCRRRRSSSRP